MSETLLNIRGNNSVHVYTKLCRGVVTLFMMYLHTQVQMYTIMTVYVYLYVCLCGVCVCLDFDLSG